MRLTVWSSYSFDRHQTHCKNHMNYLPNKHTNTQHYIASSKESSQQYNTQESENQSLSVRNIKPARHEEELCVLYTRRTRTLTLHLPHLCWILFLYDCIRCLTSKRPCCCSRFSSVTHFFSLAQFISSWITEWRSS